MHTGCSPIPLRIGARILELDQVWVQHTGHTHMQVLLSTLSRKASVTGRKKLLVVAELCLMFIISLGE